MANRKSLWDIWFLTYLIVINSFLTYDAIANYINFKSNSLDYQFGRNWNMGIVHLIMECIIIPLALLPVIIYTNIVRRGNLSNDNYVLGKGNDIFHFILNENGKPNIILTNKDKYCGCKQQFLRLVRMEIPPISYVLNVIAAYVYLIPRPFMEAQLIFHSVVKPNHIWHTDLDILFDPDKQHKEFTNFEQWNFVHPMSIAYFHFGFSLFILSIKYAQVFWSVSRTFAMVLSFIMITFSIHILFEYSLASVMIKITENSLLVGSAMRLKVNGLTIIFVSSTANLILLFSFTTIFHYGILQYGNIMLHRNRRLRRQTSSSPQNTGSNQLDMSTPFSTCDSENNYSESSIEPVFSKSHLCHLLAISILLIAMCLKSPIVYLSFKHLYQCTSDSLTLVNLFMCCFFSFAWLIIWFAFALRRTWNFTIKSTFKSSCNPILMNGNTLLNNSGHLQQQLQHQMQSSFLFNRKPSELNLSKQEMMTANRNTTLDGCSDETDMSSKLSSNNYVFLQSMRNGSMSYDANTHASLLRNPLYLSYNTNNPNMPNSNLIYANEELINMRSTHTEDQLGSEHSYNSNRSKNLGFDVLPPILPNFDENRYKNFNQNSAAMEKLIPRYLRNTAPLDLNGFPQLSLAASNDLTSLTVTTSATTAATTTTMSFNNLDNNLQSLNCKPKQGGINFPSSVHFRSPEKFSTGHGLNKCTGNDYQIDYLLSQNDVIDDDDEEEPQQSHTKRQFIDGDGYNRQSIESTKAIVKPPLKFQTVEENARDILTNETDSLLQKIGVISTATDRLTSLPNTSSYESMKTKVVMSSNNSSGTSGLVNKNQSNDRMCSQV